MQAKSPANCDAHLAESIFQIRSRRSRLYSWLLFLSQSRRLPPLSGGE
ncbi:MAG: DUF6783 domain-containing protein [Anaerobutyricum soehngenii]